MSTLPSRSTRPRRAAAPPPPSSSTTPSRPKRSAGVNSRTRHHNTHDLVSRLIEVEWPDAPSPTGEIPYFVALVLSYSERRKAHKIVYLEDESIESCLLGTTPPFRRWRVTEQPSDPLIGSRLRFTDPAVQPGDEAWYDFMRANPNRRTAPFEAFVYACISDPGPDEISGPHDTSSGDTNYYRVIHAPNDYVTTVHLASTKYTVQENLKQVDEDSQNLSAVAKSIAPVSAGGDAAVGHEDDVGDNNNNHASGVVVSPSAPGRSRVRTTPSKAVDVIPDDDGLPLDLGGGGGTDGADTDRIEAVGSNAIEGSPATQDTRDESLAPGSGSRGARGSRARSTMKNEDGVTLVVDNDDADTASEEEGVGWMSRDNRGDEAEGNGSGDMDGSQVGEYISLDFGGQIRKAYVAAFLPATGSHFVTFCDAGGGNMQVKLTRDNHWVLSDKEVMQLTKTQARHGASSGVVGRGGGGLDVQDVDADDEEVGGSRRRDVDDGDGAEEVEEVEEVGSGRRGRKRKVMSGGGRGRQSGTRRTKAKDEDRSLTVGGSGGAKKKAKRRYSGGKILGKSAGSEIVSRCVTVVWPDTTLVYVALVMGYSVQAKQHMLLYMSDHCVETLELKYREWELLPRGKEPWNSSGMVGKRVFVWWPGEYVEADVQERAEELFGPGKSKVAYEAYVLTFIGQGKYKIIYPNNEDCEERELSADKTDGATPLDKEWDILEEGVNDVMGLPVIGWEG